MDGRPMTLNAISFNSIADRLDVASATISLNAELALDPLHDLWILPDKTFHAAGALTCAGGLATAFSGASITDTKILFGDCAITGLADATTFALSGLQANASQVSFDSGQIQIGPSLALGNGGLWDGAIHGTAESRMSLGNSGYSGVDNHVTIHDLLVKKGTLQSGDCAFMAGSYTLETPPGRIGLQYQFGAHCFQLAAARVASWRLDNNITGLKFSAPIVSAGAILDLGGGLFTCGGDLQVDFTASQHDKDRIRISSGAVSGAYLDTSVNLSGITLASGGAEECAAGGFTYMGESLAFNKAQFQDTGIHSIDGVKMHLNPQDVAFSDLLISHTAITFANNALGIAIAGASIDIASNGARPKKEASRWELTVKSFSDISGVTNVSIKTLYTDAHDLKCDAGASCDYGGFRVSNLSVGVVNSGLRFASANFSVHDADAAWRVLNLSNCVFSKDGIAIGQAATNFSGGGAINYTLKNIQIHYNDSLEFGSIAPSAQPAHVGGFSFTNIKYIKSAGGLVLSPGVSFKANDLDVKLGGGALNSYGGPSVTATVTYAYDYNTDHGKRIQGAKSFDVSAYYDATGVYVPNGSKFNLLGMEWEVAATRMLDWMKIKDGVEIVSVKSTIESPGLGQFWNAKPDGWTADNKPGGLYLRGVKTLANSRPPLPPKEIQVHHILITGDYYDFLETLQYGQYELAGVKTGFDKFYNQSEDSYVERIPESYSHDWNTGDDTPSHNRELFCPGMIYHVPKHSDAPLKYKAPENTISGRHVHAEKIRNVGWWTIPISNFKLGDMLMRYNENDDILEGETGLWVDLLIVKGGVHAMFEIAEGDLNRLAFDVVFPPLTQPPVAGVPGFFWKRFYGEVDNIQRRTEILNGKEYTPPLTFRGIVGVSGGPVVKLPILKADVPILYIEGYGMFSCDGVVEVGGYTSLLNVIKLGDVKARLTCTGPEKGFLADGVLGVSIWGYDICQAAGAHLKITEQDLDVNARVALAVPAPIPLIGALKFGEVELGVKTHSEPTNDGSLMTRYKITQATLYGYLMLQLFPCLPYCADWDWCHWHGIPYPCCDDWDSWCPPKVRIDWEIGLPQGPFDIHVESDADPVHPWRQAHDRWVAMPPSALPSLAASSGGALSDANANAPAVSAMRMRAMINWNRVSETFRSDPGVTVRHVTVARAALSPSLVNGGLAAAAAFPRAADAPILLSTEEITAGDLTSGTQYFIRLHYENPDGNPAFHLVAPDGSVYTPENSPWVFGEEGRYAYYRANTDARDASYLVPSAQGGVHSVRILYPETLGDYVIEALAPNEPPTLSILNYACDGQTINIQWLGQDAEDNTTVSIFLASRPDKSGALIPLSGEILEDRSGTTGTLAFDLATSPMAAGYYWVAASINDGRHAPLFVFSPQTIYIPDTDAPPIVTGVQVAAINGEVHVVWDRVNDPDILGYTVLWSDQPQSEGYNHSLSAAPSQNWAVLSGLALSQTYRIGVAAIKSTSSSAEARLNMSAVMKQYAQGVLNAPAANAPLIALSGGGSPAAMLDLLDAEQAIAGLWRARASQLKAQTLALGDSQSSIQDSQFTTDLPAWRITSLAQQAIELIKAGRSEQRRRIASAAFDQLLAQSNAPRFSLAVMDDSSTGSQSEMRDVQGAVTNTGAFLLLNENGNNPPIFTSTPGRTAVYGSEYQYAVSAYDPDGDVLGLQLIQQPDGMTITSGGLVTWTPQTGQPNYNIVTIQALDARGAATSQTFDIRVADQPEAKPAKLWFVSKPDLDVLAGTTYTYQIQTAQDGKKTSDSDTYPPNYALLDAPAGIEINLSNGLLTWGTLRPDDIGSCRVTIKAWLPCSKCDPVVAYQTFVLNVKDYVDGALFTNPPVMNAEPLWTAGLQNTVSWSAVDTALSYTVQISAAADFSSGVAAQDTATSALCQAVFESLLDGQTYWYRVRCNFDHDRAGNWSDPVFSTQDATAPEGALSINGGAAFCSDTVVLLSIAASDAGANPSGVTSMSLSNDGFVWSGWQPYAATCDWNLAAGDGLKTVYVSVCDAAGNVLQQDLAAFITLKATPPSVALISLAADPTSAAPILVTADFSEAVTGFDLLRVQAINAVASNLTPVSATRCTFNLQPSRDGAVSAQVTSGACIDAYGNPNAPSNTLDRVYDTTPPTLPMGIALLTANPTHSTSIQFRLKFSEDVVGLGAGDIIVSGTLAAGAITSVQGGLRDYTAVVTVSDPQADGDLFIDIGAGVYDLAGNAFVSDGPSARCIIDHTIPQMHPEPLWTSGTQNTVFWDAGRNATSYVAQIAANAAFAPEMISITLPATTQSVTFENLTDGQTYWYRAAAADTTGTLGEWSAAVFSTQDATPPTGTLAIAAGADFAGTSVVSLALAAYDGGVNPSGVKAVRARNAGDPWSEWTTFTAAMDWALAPGEGAKTVEAQYRDAAGNLSTGTISASVTVDLTPPSGTIAINGGAAYTSATTVSLAISASDAGAAPSGVEAMQFSNDGVIWSAWAPYAAAADYPWALDQGEGLQTVRARFRDRAGNVSQADISAAIILDSAQPAVELTASVSGVTSGGPIQVVARFSEAVSGFTSAAIATSNCAVQGFAAVSSDTYSFLLQPLASGDFMTSIPAGVCTDAAGNVNLASRAIIWTCDQSPPTVIGGIALLTPSPGNFDSIVFCVAFSKPVEGFDASKVIVSASPALGAMNVSLTGDATSATTITITVGDPDASGMVSISLADGLADEVGNPLVNPGPSPACVLDNAAPVIFALPRWTSGTMNTLQWAPTPTAAIYEIQVNDSADFALPLLSADTATSAPSATIQYLTDGQTYWYRVRAKDAWGNPGAWSGATSSTQDASAPTVYLSVNNGAQIIFSEATTLTISSNDGANGSGAEAMRFSLDGISWTEWETYAPYRNWLFSPPNGFKEIFIQVCDRAGNVAGAGAGAQLILTGTVVVDVTPASATWSFTDGDEVMRNGTGASVITSVATGLITLTWDALPGYIAPAPNPTTATLAKDGVTTFTGVYTLIEYTLMAFAMHGSVTRNPDLPTYPQGTTVTLTAMPDANYHFVLWTGDVPPGNETDNPLIVTMDRDRILTATIARDIATVIVQAQPASAPWVFTDGDGAVTSGTGSQNLNGVPTGLVEIVWQLLSGFDLPLTNPMSQSLDRGTTITFTGSYTLPAALLHAFLSGAAGLTSEQREAADVNKDGAIDIADLLALIAHGR
ncbi:MAG: Ig-like domain-containing protein [Candidatus Sumerlaeota bacterium]|nr:Ig-like domain-containing protein [Candidatus Sumerlaeota bacterium]